MSPEKTILLVEDNDDDETLTLRALEANNICNKVHVVRDGVQALEYLLGSDAGGAKPRPLPEVVLLDLKLPRLDGLQVLERIRAEERTRLLPVVILTSSKEESDLIKGYEKGANSYVCKPVDFDRFCDAVRQLGLYWLVLNEKPNRTKEQ